MAKSLKQLFIHCPRCNTKITLDVNVDQELLDQKLVPYTALAKATFEKRKWKREYEKIAKGQ
jgi:hypothetical protein